MTSIILNLASAGPSRRPESGSATATRASSLPVLPIKICFLLVRPPSLSLWILKTDLFSSLPFEITSTPGLSSLQPKKPSFCRPISFDNQTVDMVRCVSSAVAVSSSGTLSHSTLLLPFFATMTRYRVMTWNSTHPNEISLMHPLAIYPSSTQ